MPEENEKNGGIAAFLAKLTALGIAGLIAAGAFAGMGLFMFNMGRDMSTMTKAAAQMAEDINNFTRPECIMTPFR